MKSRKKDLLVSGLIGTVVLFGVCCFMTYIPDCKVEADNAAYLAGVILAVLWANSRLNNFRNKVVAYALRWCLYAVMFYEFNVLAGFSYRWEIVLLLATYLIGSDWYRNDYRPLKGEDRKSGSIRFK